MVGRELLLLLTVLFLTLPDAQGFSSCCRWRKCHCKLYELLYGAGNHGAGILTVGKRDSELLSEHPYLIWSRGARSRMARAGGSPAPHPVARRSPATEASSLQQALRPVAEALSIRSSAQ
ncbi:hypothetical protein scyTo_2000007 [Scyliorhinus torazame]|uniref:Hypocretin neuropeptide precursor n=1 Tax=Scyliorhinus torazame TaxID=75743 RepID=A0A401PRX6_SCYTO|nr:hypothetical protein [Scyliorhinus torazame]